MEENDIILNDTDRQIIAGYSEVAARRFAPKPNEQDAWERIQRRIGNNDEEAPKTRPYIYIIRWSAVAAAVVALVVMMFVWPKADDSFDRLAAEDAPQIAEDAPLIADNGNLVAYQSTNKPSDVVISYDASNLFSSRKEEKTISKVITMGKATIGPSSADFSANSVIESSNDNVERMTITIPRGKLYTLTLPDGTKVWLNADSRMQFPSRFVGKERVVRLYGEAYFKVAHNACCPFIVEAGGLRTKVLGTEFNMRTYAHEAPKVALIKGSVKVDNAKGESVVLCPGQAVTESKGSMSVEKVDTDYYTQWKEGMFYFEQASLVDIMREIGRWYNVGIEIADKELAAYTLHFVASHDDTIEQIVDDLNFFSYLNVTKKGEKLIISKK